MRPLSVKPVPDTVAADTVTLVPPGFFNVSEISCVLPTCTLPKLTLDGVADTLPGSVTVAVSGIFKVEFEALLAMATFPLGVPEVCGASVTVNVAVFPAAMVNGIFNPLML